MLVVITATSIVKPVLKINYFEDAISLKLSIIIGTGSITGAASM
jgi:hypothetical protein